MALGKSFPTFLMNYWLNMHSTEPNNRIDAEMVVALSHVVMTGDVNPDFHNPLLG